MLHGLVMIDIVGTELTDADRDLLRHPATGGVILFTRNFSSTRQLYRLTREIHELRSPHLLIAVDQEGGRVQRFQQGFTRLPAAAGYWQCAHGDERAARHAARELGWEIAAAVSGEGRIEATDQTFWFGFKDDVVVRVRAADGGSRVDVRSVSRVGRSDVGTNARRIRRFLQRVKSKAGDY